jgi:small subunit ribosomal protein S20
MANLASVIKRNRQSQKRRARNQTVRTTVKNAVKEVRQAVAAQDPARAAEALKAAMRTLDKARSKGVLHRRTASRQISRLAKGVSKASA